MRQRKNTVYDYETKEKKQYMTMRQKKDKVEHS